MKKTITKSFETVVCDICGQEEDFSRRIEIKSCTFCKQDMCSDCEVRLFYTFKKKGTTYKSEAFFCKTHLPDSLLSKLTEKGV